MENTFEFLGYSFTLGRFLIMTASSILGFLVVFLTGYVSVKKIIWPKCSESVKKVFEPYLHKAKTEIEEKLQKDIQNVLGIVKELTETFDVHLENEKAKDEIKEKIDISMIRQSVARASADALMTGYVDPYVLAAYCEIEEIYTEDLGQNSYVKDRVEEMKAVSKMYNKRKRQSEKEKKK